MYLGSIWYHLPKTTLFNNVAAVRSLKTVKFGNFHCPLVTVSTMAGRWPKSSAADEIEQKEFDEVVYSESAHCSVLFEDAYPDYACPRRTGLRQLAHMFVQGLVTPCWEDNDALSKTSSFQ